MVAEEQPLRDSGSAAGILPVTLLSFGLVNIDYRDQKGKRSTRAIEAYSLRRSRAGDVLLMAVRADDGHPKPRTTICILVLSPPRERPIA